MLSKKDLVKEFELVVQQEITNHNREIAQSNQMMNRVLARVEECEDAQKRLARDVGLRQIQLEQAVDEFQKKFIALSNIHKAQQVKICRHQEAQVECLADIQDQLEETRSDLQESFVCQSRTELKLSETRDDAIQNCKSSRYDLEKLKRLFEKQIERVEESFRQLPCKSLAEIQRHEKSLTAMTSSITSIYEELNNHKEKRLYNEKQTEHAFTLIQRLKRQIEP